ncbi:MAG TPA: lipoyl(octanoyl) transferase LipB [Actinomycetota bacterium]|nr:lipoyl(octanoyl) transferase LipB [Actinomycetota bacterium]
MERAAWLLEPPGLIPYAVANDAMHELADRRLAGEIPDAVLLLEHPHVFTAGRRAKPDELLWSPEELEARGAEVHRIDRGGSFTHHGPGQLVGYPILDLGTKPDAMRYVRSLEEVVIRAGRDLGVELERRTDVQTGVWRGDDKVCAIGVRLMRARITLHGFAINCDNDLSWFRGIVACGLPEHGVTSLTELAGRHVGVEEARTCVKHHVSSVFGLAFEPAPQDAFALVPAR